MATHVNVIDGRGQQSDDDGYQGNDGIQDAAEVKVVDFADDIGFVGLFLLSTRVIRVRIFPRKADDTDY